MSRPRGGAPPSPTARPQPLVCRCGAPSNLARCRSARSAWAARAGLRSRSAPADAPGDRGAPRSIWRYREWLPILGEPVVSLDTGFTPLMDAPALARGSAWARLVKNEPSRTPPCRSRIGWWRSRSTPPSGAPHRRCASTGNLANSVAAQAARAACGLDLHPGGPRAGKVVGTAVSAAPRARGGTYDDVNRSAPRSPTLRLGAREPEPAQLLRRGLEDDGFEIAEQLGWRSPTRSSRRWRAAPRDEARQGLPRARGRASWRAPADLRGAGVRLHPS